MARQSSRTTGQLVTTGRQLAWLVLHLQASYGDSNSSGDVVGSVVGSQDVCDGGIDTGCSDADGNMLVDMSSPPHDSLNRPLHYYVDVPDAEDNTYEASDRNMDIDPIFRAQL